MGCPLLFGQPFILSVDFHDFDFRAGNHRSALMHTDEGGTAFTIQTTFGILDAWRPAPRQAVRPP